MAIRTRAGNGVRQPRSTRLRAAQQPHPLFPPKIFETHTFSIGLLGNLFHKKK